MKNRKVIEELFNSYKTRRESYQNKIDSNNNRIAAIDRYLSSVESSDDDVRIFSPRSIDDLYDGRISKEKELKESLIKENDVKSQVVKELDIRIAQFQEVLDNNSDDDLIEESLSSEENTVTDIDDKSVDDSNNRSNEFKKYILDIQEKERQRIANELHDTTVQNLVHLVHSIELSSMFVDSDHVRAKLELESCVKNLKSTIAEIRETIFNLRPMSFDDLGFTKSMDDFMNNMMVQYPDVLLQFDVEDVGFEPQYNMNVFRIIQECVINSLKHSKSPDLMLHVKHLDEICDIEVLDHGVGFDYTNMKNNHFGMSILEERVKVLNGTIDIDSEINKGTRIHIQIPIKQPVL